MPESIAYTQTQPEAGEAGLSPLLPLSLLGSSGEVSAVGLLDSGAAVNVLPWEIGLQLGLTWEEQRIPLFLSGNLAQSEARAVLLDVQVLSFETVRLAFAWTQSPGNRLLLGQVNFFRAFNICFFGSENRFEIERR